MALTHWLKNLLTGGASPPQPSCVRDLLADHVARLLAGNPKWSQSNEMRSILTSLIEGNCLEFTKAAVTEGVQEALAKKTQVCRRGSFLNVYLAVSIVPTLAPSQIRAYFPRGYGEFVTDLLNASNYTRGQVSLAHWTWGSDGNRSCAHLTLFPAMELVRQRVQGLGTVVAKDLYTEQELAERGLA